MKGYKLSIIIPHYNTPDLLVKLLDSIPARDDIQAIVVDDNSTKKCDELKAVIEKHSERNLEFYRNETGKNSAGTCRNIGLEHAKGKWIVFADSDDYFVDGWFDIVSEYFDSDNEIVFFNPTSIVLDTGMPGTRHKVYSDMVEAYLKNPSHENEILLRYAFTVPWSKLYRKSSIDKYAIRFEPVRYANDERFALTCGYNLKKFACSDETIYCVTLHSNSLTTTPSKENYDTRQRVNIRKYAFLYENLSSEDIHTLGMDYIPLYTLCNTIVCGYGIKLAIDYRKMMRSLNVPLANKKYVNLPKIVLITFKSVIRRLCTVFGRKKS